MQAIKNIKHKTKVRTRTKKVVRKLKTIPYVYRTAGMAGVRASFKEVFKQRISRRKIKELERAGDVLIISISSAPTIDRYRADHMKESLESTGVVVDKVFYYELTPKHIKNYNTFIFYRVPWLSSYKKYFEEIKRKNKVAVYAIDDLVIDTKYTDTIPAVQRMGKEDRVLYDDGVNRHKKVMEHCDYAITTTECLAKELRKYDYLKKVYIDRNAMSDEMTYFSKKAISEVKNDDKKIVIGYFSGSNTHNEDFEMIAPALHRIMKENKNVYVKLAGIVDAPDQLRDFSDRLISTPYVDWRKLPYELRKCDIILAPLVDSLFNRAKSEIKWSEAALVKVPVVASDLGAFKEVVEHGKTGLLAKNNIESWYECTQKLIDSKELRDKIAAEAHEYVLTNCRTTGSNAAKLSSFISNITPPVIGFAGINIGALSGGNMVVKKHMDLLREAGSIVYGVESMSYQEEDEWDAINKADDKNYDIFRINSKRKRDRVNLQMHFDRLVATFWASVDMVDEYKYINKNGKKLYLVQNMEADFYDLNDKTRLNVLATYYNNRLTPITISKWCQKWLQTDFGRKAQYAPNGIDLNIFKYTKRTFDENKKIKVLIEGDSASEYKKVDESFKIANKLDRSKYEVSYLSYNAPPKDWYNVDNIFMKVPQQEVGKVYAQHDILLKSSILESFSYPPLEMMATGGFVVVAPNEGNIEYLIDGINCLFYKREDVADALEKIRTLVYENQTRNRLAEGGKETANKLKWDNINSKITKLYQQ